ncbi:MAG TPA: Flp family type IVb pilin [Limnochordia bacterium]|nr:Flp family type IVb pilin [Limnochordia bacterium]
MLQRFSQFWADESGQGMVEYGLILALIAVVVVGVLVTLGGGIKGIFQKANNCLSATTGTGC